MRHKPRVATWNGREGTNDNDFGVVGDDLTVVGKVIGGG